MQGSIKYNYELGQLYFNPQINHPLLALLGMER